MSRCLLALMFALVVCAQESEESPPQYHFVFIVDTSISMADRKSAVLSAMRDLCRSSFAGQIEDGDVIDVWTCDTPKDPDPFDPLLWFARRGGAISIRAGEYVSSKKFHRGGHITPALAELTAVLPTTTGLMVIVLTDGEEPISGFSFDAELNQEVAKVRRDAAKTKRPIMVALSAVDGEWSDWKVKLGTDKPDLPHLPKREKPAPEPVLASKTEQTTTVEKTLEPEPPAPVVFNYPPGAKIMPSSAPVERLTPVHTVPPAAVQTTTVIPTKAPEPEVPHSAPLTNALAGTATTPPTTATTQVIAQAIVTLALPTNSPAVTPRTNIVSVVKASAADPRPTEFPPVYLLASVGSLCVLAAGLLAARRPNRIPKGSIISRSLAK